MARANFGKKKKSEICWVELRREEEGRWDQMPAVASSSHSLPPFSPPIRSPAAPRVDLGRSNRERAPMPTELRRSWSWSWPWNLGGSWRPRRRLWRLPRRCRRCQATCGSSSTDLGSPPRTAPTAASAPPWSAAPPSALAPGTAMGRGMRMLNLCWLRWLARGQRRLFWALGFRPPLIWGGAESEGWREREREREWRERRGSGGYL